jgi:hypothetical protein
LRRLTRQGYVANAAQGLDLVHDFFAEAWPAILERYDPARGPLDRYAAAAFVRFVRPRLVREARWAAALSDEGPLVDSAQKPMSDPLEPRLVLAALEELDRVDRDVLLARFGAPDTPERVLARHAGLRRYRFRERLAKGLTRLSVILEERGALPPSAAAVARQVFEEGVPVSRAAGDLAMAESEVRAIRERILHGLGKAAFEASL